MNKNQVKSKEELASLTSQEWRALGHEKANEILEPMEPVERLEVLKNAPPTMLPYEYWIAKSKRDLIHYYMNAKSTCSCLGHWKGQQNDFLCEKYRKEMERFNVPIPSDEIAYALGIFNGKGSY